MKKLITLIVIIINANCFSQDSLNADCNFRTKEVDEFTGTSKLVLESDKFISFTDSSMQKYYRKKQNQYVEVDVYCAKINDTKVAYLSIRIDTDNAYKYFGSIQKDQKFMLKMKNGDLVTLLFSKSDYGDANYNGNYTYYSSYIILEESDIEKLSEQVEKVRIYWSKGYEDYPVTNSDLFINQLNCIK